MNRNLMTDLGSNPIGHYTVDNGLHFITVALHRSMYDTSVNKKRKPHDGGFLFLLLYISALSVKRCSPWCLQHDCVLLVAERYGEISLL